MINEKSSKPVEQLLLEEEYIWADKSVKEASETLGLTNGAISNAIRKGATSGGYRWRHHRIERILYQYSGGTL